MLRHYGFGPVVMRRTVTELSARLRRLLGETGRVVSGPETRYFQTPTELGECVTVHVGLPVLRTAEPTDCTVTELPPVEAATLVYPGLTHGLLDVARQVVRWAGDHGMRFTRPAREQVLDPGGDGRDPVVELQVPVTAAAPAVPPAT